MAAGFVTTLQERVALLKAMDTVIANLNDEMLEIPWKMGGVPDCASEADIEDIACDPELFGHAVSIFSEIMRSDEFAETGFCY